MRYIDWCERRGAAEEDETMRKVTLDTRPVGLNFGTVGVVRDAKTGRKIAESATTRPVGHTRGAISDAQRVAWRHGWTVVDRDAA